MNRPDDLNATNHVLHEALSRLWPQVDADLEARAVVLTGNGRAFSAGGDFDYIDELSQRPGAAPPVAHPRSPDRASAWPDAGCRSSRR